MVQQTANVMRPPRTDFSVYVDWTLGNASNVRSGASASSSDRTPLVDGGAGEGERYGCERGWREGAVDEVGYILSLSWTEGVVVCEAGRGCVLWVGSRARWHRIHRPLTTTVDFTTSSSSFATKTSSMPPRTCQLCHSARAVIKRPKTAQNVCRPCFFYVFETEIHNTIVHSNLFSRGDRVAIGASGGKGPSSLPPRAEFAFERTTDR